jgi:hypothetical protein
MASMVDLLEAAQKAGFPVEVTPTFLTNGHNGITTLSPRCGYLHHTDSTTLTSVYYDPGKHPGWPTEEWRPTVPSPRCQVYAARARAEGCRTGCTFKGKAHLVFVSAGVAYQAGDANRSRLTAARAGRITASTPNAYDSGLLDDTNGNNESMGIEIDWRTGEGWPADLLALVCRLMALAVRVFGWPGVGSWIRHRQATRRKPDPQTDYDFWAHAASGEEADMLSDERTALFDIHRWVQTLGQQGTTLIDKINRTGGNVEAVRLALLAGIEQDADRDVRILGRLDALDLDLSPEDTAQLAASLDLDEDRVAEAMQRRLAEALSAGPAA